MAKNHDFGQCFEDRRFVRNGTAGPKYASFERPRPVNTNKFDLVEKVDFSMFCGRVKG